MNHASLFSGIGGFDLAAEWAGFENIFNCEIDPFCQQILKYYWPHAKQYEDIRTTDFTIWRGKIDILTGGFPCQPFSNAGKRKGTDDDRHLWPEMLRAIREIKPSWIVGENVFGIINWSQGLVFKQVCSDLEAEGYEVQPFIIPACGVNAPHKRDRVWFIANSDSVQSQGSKQYRGIEKERPTQKESRQFSRSVCSKWQVFPTKSPICRGNDGFSGIVDIVTLLENRQAREPYIRFGRWRKQSIKGYGNAVVPQIPFRIFEAIKEYEKLL